MRINNRFGSYFLAMEVTAAVGLLGCGSPDADTSGKPGAQPNVLLIVSDDQGYADFGAFGGRSDVKTPNLDNLANSGVRFSNAYVTMSICSPSRMSILTGRQQQRWGVYNYGASLPDSEITLAEQLKEQGYSTGMVGKSHYGSYAGPEAPEFPTNHGFDYFYGKEGGTMDYLRHKAADREDFTTKMANHLGIGPFWENEQLKDTTGYSTDIILDKSLEFINRHQRDPFFLMVSFNAVHLFTHQIPEEDLKKMGVEKVPDWDPETGTWAEYLEWYVNTVKPNTPEGRKRYLYHLHRMDDAIGALLGNLEEKGLRENTIVVFISDNGGSPRTYAINDPLRGNKYILDEGGIRVPMVVSWPEKIKGGRVFDKMVSGMDIFPTLHDALGMEMPRDREIDGVSLLPAIQGEVAEAPHEWLFWTGFHPTGEPKTYDDPDGALARHDRTYNGDLNGWAVRYGNWKLRFYGTSGTYGLYDLSADIGESNNLAKRHPELVERMMSRYYQWHENIKKNHEKYKVPASSEF
ncbi:sulfatase [Marinilabilia salmonicolor]|uniref:Arylsulfatase A-like enzyme n=1 Tax=Marinilabilia salmonicolor TaxID=989 RepID=A0A368V8Q5_9BACT|nr:sulfatase-like hydrolase/transferase [Marinilabilia salmonicolor]RCW37597.1 arylsulfatase A-like enzyme [Marinilabilia salmonicolor]